MKSTVLPFNFYTATLLFLGLLAGQTLIALLGVVCLYILHVDYLQSSIFMVVGYAISMVFPILFYHFFVLRPKQLYFKVDVRPTTLMTYLLVLPAMFGLMLIMEYLITLIPTSGPVFGSLYESYINQLSSLAMDNVSLIVLTVVLAPILEELLFRGIIQKSLIKSGINPRWAIVIASFVFGAFHVYPWQFLGAFSIGLFLGFTYEKTGSLLVPIVLHMFNNLISALLMMKFGSNYSDGLLPIEPVYSFLIGIGIFNLFMLALRFYFKRKASIFGA